MKPATRVCHCVIAATLKNNAETAFVSSISIEKRDYVYMHLFLVTEQHLSDKKDWRAEKQVNQRREEFGQRDKGLRESLPTSDHTSFHLIED